ncbi:hypothetical protein Xmau_00160 [Xenorhabdus mauleonii]|uniref:Uncharacterized protein n=1 Tax=Xenorhabdus mauleonii TaxID=351675 RepID=A0A1I3N5X1_9GAMM|nr:hypothetical protein Xmau_00160 [Xenorhabdus mauleonii]SFJ04651.1 hypothetical protein SAMN05421680_105100 [Xenorhabdus mauleonii]
MDNNELYSLSMNKNKLNEMVIKTFLSLQKTRTIILS